FSCCRFSASMPRATRERACLQLFHCGSRRLVEDRHAVAVQVDAVEHQAMQMNIQIGRRAEALNERPCRLGVLQRNVAHLIDLTRKLEAVARMEPTHDNAVVQEIDVSTIVEEAARQLREMAEARGAVASGVVPVVVGWP